MTAQEIADLRETLHGDEDALYRLQIVEDLLTAAEANAARLESIQCLVKAGWKRGEECPFCKRSRRHAESCYLRTGTGFDLLEEHEATLRENDELRRALAPHLGKTQQEVLKNGKPYRSLRSRLRRKHHG